MKKIITLSLLTIGLSFIAGLFMYTPADAAINVFKEEACNGDTSICRSADSDTLFNTIKSVINIMIYVTGVIAVIMIILGGIKYTVSSGDSSAITSAKNTIIYAVVGLVIAIMSFAIVNFALSFFGGNQSGNSNPPSESNATSGSDSGSSSNPAQTQP